MSKDLTKREYIKAGAMLIGAGLIGSKTAKATTPVAGDAALGVIATNTLNTYESLKKNVDLVNKNLAKAEKIRKTGQDAFDIAEAAANFDKIIISQIKSIKKQVEGFYKVGKDPLTNPIRQISLDNEPLVKFARLATNQYEAIFNKATNDSETRKKSSASARNRSQLELAKVQAKETRKNIKEMLSISMKTPLDDKSTGEIFKSNVEPLAIDIEMQKLESQLRLEQAVVEFIEETRTGKLPEVPKFDSKAFKKSYKAMKNGDGVLA